MKQERSERQMQRRKRGSTGRRRGVALLELAFLLPILLAIGLGIIEFGRIQRSTLIIANAAREGARAAALGRSTSAIRDRILNAARPVLETDDSGNITNGSITLEQGVQSGSSITYQGWPSDVGTAPHVRNGVSPNNYARVTVAFRHASITGLFNRSVANSVVMRREE